MKKQKSFTLIEILVTLGIFSLVLEAMVGIFISAINIQRKILASEEILDQLSYVLEYMAKAIRMAKKDDIEIYRETKNCLTGNMVNYQTNFDNTSIKFRNYKNECQSFFLSENQIMEERETDTEIITLPLTSDKIKVNSLKFKISGEAQEDFLQPSVIIFLELEKTGNIVQKMKVQTTISQRDADIQY